MKSYDPKRLAQIQQNIADRVIKREQMERDRRDAVAMIYDLEGLVRELAKAARDAGCACSRFEGDDEHYPECGAVRLRATLDRVPDNLKGEK